jgi:beta-fructofuranosidase
VLALADEWVWDFWHAHDGAQHHLFFLKASKSLGDPDLRHFSQRIGHAVSPDLRTWTHLADALGPSDSGWDSGTTWTGSVIRAEGRWWMFYTGTDAAEACRIQRIGAASSTDLITWDRVSDGPLVEPDAQWYELYDPKIWHEQTWRDPWVVQGPDGRFHMYLTARVSNGPSRERGVIGHASSADLHTWAVQPPVSEPGLFGHLEVPQLITTDHGPIMLFCTTETATPLIGNGMYTLKADDDAGPFRFVKSPPIGGTQSPSLYAGRVIETAKGPMFMAFLDKDEHGHFVGEISDPMPATFSPSGEIILRRHDGQ